MTKKPERAKAKGRGKLRKKPEAQTRSATKKKAKKPNLQENKEQQVTTPTHRKKFPTVVLQVKPKWMDVTRLLQEKKLPSTSN